jgi:enamine deaminase RidA (YjgF/YER057c/UK114 family)
MKTRLVLCLALSATACSATPSQPRHSCFHALEAVEADIVNVFTTDLDAFKASKDIRKAFYSSSLPAATWVQVQRLFLPSFVLEVELIAEYPK